MEVIANWHDRKIAAGKESDGEIDEHLNTAQVILLLISPSFMSSDYCYDLEVTRAMERHKAGEAIVIPVFLRPVMWKGAPFGDLQGLPTDSKPVTDWSDRDKAFLDIAEGVRKAIERRAPRARPSMDPTAIAAPVFLPSIIFRPLLVDFVARRNSEGRDILELLKRELVPEDNRVVLLWGAGGVGKTTLAIHAARELSNGFGQRVVWASPELRSDFTMSTLLDEIATQLGRDDLRQLSPERREQAVRELIAAAPTLVILDNFETIAFDEQQPCANWLVQRALCSAIITTRQRIMGARNILIDAMSPEEAREFLELLIRQSSDPHVFTAPHRNRIIQAAGANPLVMQWMVAQIDLAQSLSDVLDDLLHGEGDAAQRVFDRSFELPHLGNDGRAALLALSLFVPNASRRALSEVAGFVSGEKRLNEAVKRLAALRLVGTTDGGERIIIQGLTRELAKARLMRNEQVGEFCQRFVERYLRYAEAHAQPTPEDFDTLEAEKDNVLSAMEMAFELKDWNTVIRIRSTLEEFLDLRGYWNEATRTGEQAINASYESKNEWAAKAFSVNTAVIHMHLGNYQNARQIYQEALDYYREVKREINIARVLHNLGVVKYDGGNLNEAEDFYSKSLEIKGRLGDESGIANTLYQKGMVAEDREDFFEAHRCYAESLKIRKKFNDQNNLSDQNNLAITLYNLAVIARYQNDFKKVRELYRESLEITKRLGDQYGVALILHELGMNEESLRLYEDARQCYEEGVAVSRRIGFRFGMAITLRRLETIAKNLGNLSEAQQYNDESQEIRGKISNKELGNRRGIATTLYSLRLIARDDSYMVEAARLMREALYIFEKIKPFRAEPAP